MCLVLIMIVPKHKKRKIVYKSFKNIITSLNNYVEVRCLA